MCTHTHTLLACSCAHIVEKSRLQSNLYFVGVKVQRAALQVSFLYSTESIDLLRIVTGSEGDQQSGGNLYIFVLEKVALIGNCCAGCVGLHKYGLFYPLPFLFGDPILGHMLKI
jgi:hypothetical protein